MAEVARHIRSSFDLGWSGISSAELAASVSCGIGKPHRHSLQVDPQISLQLSCPPLPDVCAGRDQLLTSDTAELLLLLQQQQQQQQQAQAQVEDDAPTADELGIDAQIKRLLQLKQFLRSSKLAVVQQQQQQVILEGVELAAQAPNAMDAGTAGLLASTNLVTPLQSESLLNGSTADIQNSWSHLSAGWHAPQAGRRSVDLGGLAQQLAALELSNNAAAAGLNNPQGLCGGGMRPSSSFTAGTNTNNRLSIDMGVSGLSDMEVSIAAAAMAAAANAQADASRRESLCLTTPHMSGLLDSMLLDSMASAQVCQLQAPLPSPDVMAAGTALAMQSALYGSAMPALDAQLQGPMVTAGMVNMPPASSLAATQAPARHSLDCSLLSAGGLAQATLGSLGLPSPSPRTGHASGLPSPACRRASFNIPQRHVLGDRSAVMAHAQAQQAQAASEAAGWGFSSRRTSGRRSMDVPDVRRVSSDSVRVQTPDLRQPPRKSVSLITPPGSSAASSCSSSSSGRSSPRSSRPLASPNSQGNARGAGTDKPPVQPPKWSPLATGAKQGAEAAAGGVHPANASPPASSTASNTARKGTGVFIPGCMLKP